MMKVIAVCLFTAIIFSCSSDSSSSSSNQNTINAIVNAAASGSWRITYYYDSDHEETSNYTGYDFTFAANNILTAVNGSNTYTGAWSVTDSNSSSSSSDDIHFNILFTAPPFMQELSDDWEIISYSSTEIKLTDVSGGNGGVDFLTFTKN